VTSSHSHFSTTRRALDGGVDGMFVMGRNPAVARRTRGCSAAARAKLKWLVVREMGEMESANFWRESPEVKSGELRTEAIQTEVFLMPAASHIEKDGTFTNTQRLVQFHDKALNPPGDARSELWFMHHLRLRAGLYGLGDFYRTESGQRSVDKEDLDRDVGLHVRLGEERHDVAAGELSNRLLVAFFHNALEVLAHRDHALRVAAVHDRLLERREAASAHDHDDDVIERVGLRLHRPAPIVLPENRDDARRDRRQELSSPEA
jgi:anaerobic selenocysteine-containing dehydrogenase